MKYIIYITLFVSQCTWAQLNTYSFEDVENLEEKRPVVVFLHAKWCKYCKVMEHITFESEKVIEKLNDDFYFVAFDGEYKNSINFKNHIFKYKATGRKTGVHELAEALGTFKSKVSYPTTVVLNTENEIVFQYPYVLKTDEFLNVLNSIK